MRWQRERRTEEAAPVVRLADGNRRPERGNRQKDQAMNFEDLLGRTLGQ